MQEVSNNFKALIQQLLHNDYNNYKNFRYGTNINVQSEEPTLFSEGSSIFDDKNGESNHFINLNPFQNKLTLCNFTDKLTKQLDNFERSNYSGIRLSSDIIGSTNISENFNLLPQSHIYKTFNQIEKFPPNTASTQLTTNETYCIHLVLENKTNIQQSIVQI